MDNSIPGTRAMARRIEVWPVERLVPFARNARTHSDEQVAQIAASIAEFGFSNPLLVDSAAGILAGHGRLLAARKLGLPEAPVIVLDHLTETQKRAYILADNKLALNAGWNQELLAAKLADLERQGFDLPLIGFSDSELEALLADEEQQAGNQDAEAEEDIPEAPAVSVTRPGDQWIIGPHRLWCGDCRSEAARLFMGEVRANVVITSPPYATQRECDPSGGDLRLAGVSVAFGVAHGTLRFVAASGVQPAVIDDGVPGVVAVAWLESLRVGAGERLLLGTLEMPSAAAGSVLVHGADAVAEDGKPVGLSASGHVRE